MKELKSSVIIDQNTQKQLDEYGYAIIGNTGKLVLKNIQDVYHKNHSNIDEQVGVFHTLYSNDLTYRERIHKEINSILKPVLNQYFISYKITAHLIIAKFFNNNSAFEIHQDTTGLDESKHTSLNLWIPLQKTTLKNGCLCVVPKSHLFAFPYRGTSFSGQFDKITALVKNYLLPIELNAGDILLFDNRLLHYSPPNTTTKPRIVTMSGVFYKDAEILTCFKNMENENSPIEIYQQKDDYLLTHTGFKSAPSNNNGIKVGETNIQAPISTEEDFLNLANQYALMVYDVFSNKNQTPINPLLTRLKALWR